MLGIWMRRIILPIGLNNSDEHISKDCKQNAFVCHIPNKYLVLLKIHDPLLATPKQLDRLLRISYLDFLSFHLDLDEFSTICENVWWILIHQKKESIFHDLADAAYSGSELSWYMRHIQSSDTKSIANWFSGIQEYVAQRDIR